MLRLTCAAFLSCVVLSSNVCRATDYFPLERTDDDDVYGVLYARAQASGYQAPSQQDFGGAQGETFATDFLSVSAGGNEVLLEQTVEVNTAQNATTLTAESEIGIFATTTAVFQDGLAEWTENGQAAAVYTVRGITGSSSTTGTLHGAIYLLCTSTFYGNTDYNGGGFSFYLGGSLINASRNTGNNGWVIYGNVYVDGVSEEYMDFAGDNLDDLIQVDQPIDVNDAFPIGCYSSTSGRGYADTNTTHEGYWNLNAFAWAFVEE